MSVFEEYFTFFCVFCFFLPLSTFCIKLTLSICKYCCRLSVVFKKTEIIVYVISNDNLCIYLKKNSNCFYNTKTIMYFNDLSLNLSIVFSSLKK